MTRRAWIILVVGLLVVAVGGAFAAMSSSASSSFTPSASWGLYAPARWEAVKTGFARRGFDRDSVRMVTGTSLANGRPFALLRARSHDGRMCFAVVRRAAIGTTICHISKPLLVFAAADTCAACSPGKEPMKTLSILALVRRDAAFVTMTNHGRESGIGIVPAGARGAYAFNAGAVGGGLLRARDSANRVLAEVVLARR